MVKHIAVLDALARVRFLRNLAVVAPPAWVQRRGVRRHCCILFGDEQATAVLQQVGVLLIAPVVDMDLSMLDRQPT